MKGSLWKCSHLQCKLATSEEHRGLEIQNMLLNDMRQELLQPGLRRNYVDVEREGAPASTGLSTGGASEHTPENDVIVEQSPPEPAAPSEPAPPDPPPPPSAPPVLLRFAVAPSPSPNTNRALPTISISLPGPLESRLAGVAGWRV